ncbi:MAG TPA: universal stress protein [Candidatus Acidoferrum sp.]|nr:universal stress protein [Candidatus Acidoferrum sp.]
MAHVMEPKATQEFSIAMGEISKKVSLTRILVTTDFSTESDRALDYALALARRYDARIYLAHVIAPDPFLYAEPALAQATYEKVRQAAEQGMADILVSGRLRGVPHEVLLEEGSVWPAIEKLIGEHEIDLVVTATHGRGKVQKVLIGSVAEEIFRQADCAVLTVGPRVKDEPAREVELKNILFATDFGHGAEKAAAHAFSLAQEHGARLTMLHVIQEATAFTEESVRQQREAAVRRLEKLMPEGAENWCKPVFRATFGEATEEIITMARETNADLIVMGAKARKNLAGHAPFAIAYHVVTKANCPVLTVRG